MSDELVQRVAVDAKCCRPHTDSHAREAISTDRQRELRNGTLNPHTQLLNLRANNLLDQRNKLVTSIPRQKIVLAKLSGDEVGYLTQHLVTRFMTMGVIYLLKLIEIEHHHLEGTICTTRARSFFFKPQRETTRVRQTGERICSCVRLGFRALRGVAKRVGRQ